MQREIAEPEFWWQLILRRFLIHLTELSWSKFCKSLISEYIFCNGSRLFTTNFFSVSRGVRQGDPLSPLLFILSLEILTCYIRQDRNIHGLVINNEEIKLTLFADDVTCFLRDRLSYLHLFVILKFFSRFSGLSVNDDKTELFAIGP